MQKVKAGAPLIEIISLCFRANLPALLDGPHGIGKSELLAQAASKLGIGFVCRDLSLMEPPDLVGLPRAQKGRTVYQPPAFLPKSGQGLLVFEELNRADRFMQAPCLQLLTARTLSAYKLPEGWLPVAAINPAEASYDVSILDPALLSRFVHIHVVADRKEWLAWACQSDIHEAVIRYVESDSSVFNAPESNPRAWAYVSRLLDAAQANSVSQQALRIAIHGVVGETRGKAFLATLGKDGYPLSAGDVLSAYRKHRAKVQGWIKNGRLDLVRSTLHAVQTYLQPAADFAAVRKKRTCLKNLGDFVSDLPGDLRQSAEKFFAGRGYDCPGVNGKHSTKSKRQK